MAMDDPLNDEEQTGVDVFQDDSGTWRYGQTVTDENDEIIHEEGDVVEDSHGRPFSYEKHRTEAGSDHPDLTKNGNAISKVGQSPNSSNSNDGAGDSSDKSTQDGDSGSGKQKPEELAEATARMFWSTAEQIGGSEFAPDSDEYDSGDKDFDEHVYLRDTLADYYEKRGVPEMPPEINLLMCFVVIVGSRIDLDLDSDGPGVLQRLQEWFAMQYLYYFEPKKYEHVQQLKMDSQE